MLLFYCKHLTTYIIENDSLILVDNDANELHYNLRNLILVVDFILVADFRVSVACSDEGLLLLLDYCYSWNIYKSVNVLVVPNT